MIASTYCRVATTILLLGVLSSLYAQSPAGYGRASQPTSPSPVSVPLDEATLAALPRAAVAVIANGTTTTCTGVSLTALLTRAGVLSAEPLIGPALASYVLVTARDGNRAVYSLAELEPTLGNRNVVLVDQCDGKPLPNDTGPLRLIAPGEARTARWVRQVRTITVVAAP